jgi:hypothetical protein
MTLFDSLDIRQNVNRTRLTDAMGYDMIRTGTGLEAIS